MANVAGFRTAFIEAGEYKREWEDFVSGKGGSSDDGGEEKKPKPPKRDLGKDTLAAVLDGDIFVNIHCYRADELAVMMDLAKEMGFTITAFHHTTEAYKVADLLAENDICAVMWSDWWGYKAEALDGIPENIALVDKAGACAIAHSDSEGVIQHMNLEVAKAMAAGNRAGMEITRQHAFKWITGNPARAMRIDERVGSLEVGKDADVVIWSGDPFSIYSLAEDVFIDGAHVYDRHDPAKNPQSDYELGIVKRGDF
jgi:imidazolonepropionase-like amidohydrolase